MASRDGNRRSRLDGALGAGLLLLCAAAPYWSTRLGEPVLDDALLRGPGSLVASPDTSWTDLGLADFFGTPEEPTGQSGYWRPLVLWSFAIEHWLTRGRPEPYAWLGHVVTVAWHGLAVLALRRWLRALGVGVATSFAAAALFAVHPVHAESVTWITGRNDVMPAAFAWGGGALLLGGAGTVRVAVAALAFAAALLSKESGILLVALVPACAWLAGRRERRVWLAPALAVAAVLAVRFAFFEQRLAPDAVTGPASAAERWWSWLTIVPDLVGFAVWPIEASPLHPVTVAGGPAAPGVAAGAVLLVLVLAATAFAWVRGARAAFFATALVAGTVVMLAPWVPFPNAFAREVAAPLFERYLYAAAAGPALLAVLAARAAGVRERLGAVLLAVLIVAAGVETARRTEIWRSDESLARHGLEVAPHSAILWNHLGYARMRAFQTDDDTAAGREAARAFERALAFDPDFLQAALNRFIMSSLLEDEAAAERHAESLLRRWPEEPGVLRNVAMWHARGERWADAVRLLEREIDTARPLPGARAMLASVRAELADR